MIDKKKDSRFKRFVKWLMSKWNSFLYMLMFKKYE